MKLIALRLAGLSLSLVLIGFFLFPITAELMPTDDRDVAEMLGFSLMIVVGGLGISLGIASISILLFRLRDK